MPSRMVWVNGHGCQRAFSYWYYAAVAEMSIMSGSFRPGRADVVLSVPALISRTAGYAIRMSGAVEGALSDGRPYPYMRKCPMSRADLLFSTHRLRKGQPQEVVF